MKQTSFHEGYPPGILTDTYDVVVLQDQVVIELPQDVAMLPRQLPAQLLQPFCLSPYPQKDFKSVLKVSGTNKSAESSSSYFMVGY